MVKKHYHKWIPSATGDEGNFMFYQCSDCGKICWEKINLKFFSSIKSIKEEE